MSTEALAQAPAASASAARAATTLPPPLRSALRFAAALIAGAAATLLVTVGVSFGFGYRTFAVLSGSMEPNIHTGDAVVDEPIRPRDARIGDVITFKDPSRGGELVTHRVRSVRPVGGGVVAIVTKGDANNTVERFRVPADGSIGRVRLVLPSAGRAIAAIRGRYGRLLLIALPALLLGLYELGRIWRPRRAS